MKMYQAGLSTYLTSNLDIDPNELVSVLENCSVKEVVKDEYLLQPNEFCSAIFFVEKGLLRQFSLDEKGKEHILTFAPENWFVTDRESSYFNKPSRYFIQALENTRVAVLDDRFIQQMSQTFPTFSNFNTTLLHNNIRSLQNRINLLLSASAEDRYLQFIKMYPDILLRVPQSMVASYLGIAPESLSRVRRELAQKNFKPSS